MKTIKYISTYLFILAACIGCTKDDEMITYNPENASSGILAAIGSEYELVAQEENNTFVEFSWTASDFGFDAAIEYVLEADLAGKQFENPVEIFAVKKVISNAITVGTMNTVMTNLQKTYEFEEGEAQKIEFRLRSSISDAATPLYSNVITSTIAGYDGAAMYMIGEQFGNWNWDGNVVEMIPVKDAEGDFWCVRYIESGKGFKWSPEKDWNGKDFNQLESNSGFTTADGNAFVETSGMYMVYISTERNTMVIEPAKIYGIGEAFGNWDTETYPFTINGDKASIIATNTADLRMYATSSIAQGDWWTREFILFDGVIAYRGKGGDQDRVKIEAGQTVTLNFNTGTGTIQ